MLVQGYPSLSFSSFSSFKCQAKHLTTVSFRRTLLKKMRTQRHFPSWVAQLPRGWDKSRDGIISYWYNSMGVYGFIDYVIVNIQSLNTRTFWWSRIFEWRLPTFQEYALSATSILANRNRLVSIWPRRLSGRALYAVKCRICIYWSVCAHTHTHTHYIHCTHILTDFVLGWKKTSMRRRTTREQTRLLGCPWVHQASRSGGETNLGGDEDHPGFF